MKLFLSLLLLSTCALAFETEFSGNVEAQGRLTWNNEEAQELAFPFTQDWQQDDFFMAYGNLHGKVSFQDSRLEGNWFVRHSYTDLYRNNYFAPQIFTFPNKLVVRDLFKIQHVNETDHYRTESILNKLYYEWNQDQHRFSVGRMYINYGLGEIFNPINPFNQPTGLTSISNVAQGNDGMLFKFYKSERHAIEFYLLGDKSLYEYEGRISRTLWVHGEFQATPELQLDYVAGEDQKRHKFGGQISYSFPEAMFFMQGLYQSAYVDNFRDSHNFLDLMLGYDQQLTAKWHVRMESGYQKRNRLFSVTPDGAVAFGERFLPVEYFVAWANQYELHPLVNVSGTVINDVKSGFTYFLARSTFSLKSNLEADIFAFSPIIKGEEDTSRGNQVNNLAQKLVTQDVGISLRAFF